MKIVETLLNGIKIQSVELDIELSSDLLKAERMAICTGCEFITASTFCSQCLCLLVSKVSFVSSTCPKEKW